MFVVFLQHFQGIPDEDRYSKGTPQGQGSGERSPEEFLLGPLDQKGP